MTAQGREDKASRAASRWRRNLQRSASAFRLPERLPLVWAMIATGRRPRGHRFWKARGTENGRAPEPERATDFGWPAWHDQVTTRRRPCRLEALVLVTRTRGAVGGSEL